MNCLRAELARLSRWEDSRWGTYWDPLREIELHAPFSSACDIILFREEKPCFGCLVDLINSRYLAQIQVLQERGDSKRSKGRFWDEGWNKWTKAMECYKTYLRLFLRKNTNNPDAVLLVWFCFNYKKSIWGLQRRLFWLTTDFLCYLQWLTTNI